MVTRGEVWLAALDPTVGSKIQKTRSCLIISPAEDDAGPLRGVVVRLQAPSPPSANFFWSIAAFTVAAAAAAADGSLLAT
jgi:mRNA interferase MazF